MKKTCLMSVAAGLACCSIALAEKPPLEKARPGVQVDPISIAKVKKVNGQIVLDGEWIPYTGKGFGTRNAPIEAPFFDAFGRGGPLTATPPSAVGPGTQCVPGCDTAVDTGLRWYFGSAYHNPNTIEDMQDCACPPNSVIDEINLGWFWGPPAATQCYLIYFPIEEVLEFNGTDCTDPSTMTDTGGGGVALNYGVLAPSNPFYYYSLPTGFGFLGVISPGTDDNGDANGYADGSYQMIVAEALTSTQITLAAGPTQPMLWGTGSNSGECRPGNNNGDSYDDDAPTDGTLSNPAECYDYTFGLCPDPLAKMNAFLFLRCPADLNGDGFVDGTDSDVFFNAFESTDPAVQLCADLNGDCFVDGIDSDTFNNEFESACP